MEDTIFISAKDLTSDYLEHYGVLGMKWGVRRYQNKDGSLTAQGRKHYDKNGHPYGKNNKTSVLSQTKQERSEYAQKLLSNSGGSRGKTIAKMVAKRIGRGLARSGAATIAGVLIGTAAIPGLMAGSAPVIAGAYAIAGILDVANVTMNLQDTIGTVVRGHDVLKESKKNTESIKHKRI